MYIIPFVFDCLQNVNIGQVVSERLSAMRKLQDNPNDSQAISEMYKSQQQVLHSYIIQFYTTTALHTPIIDRQLIHSLTIS